MHDKLCLTPLHWYVQLLDTSLPWLDPVATPASLPTTVNGPVSVVVVSGKYPEIFQALSLRLTVAALVLSKRPAEGRPTAPAPWTAIAQSSASDMTVILPSVPQVPVT
jgi:hypothetical protein